jgi:hypothetical protein
VGGSRRFKSRAGLRWPYSPLPLSKPCPRSGAKWAGGSPKPAIGALHERANAQVIPNESPCMGTALNGMQVPAYQITGQPPAWAMTFWPNGIPTIVYGPMYFQLPPLIQRFTSLHECGHASTRNPDEYAANCYALSVANFSRRQVGQIRSFYEHLPGQLPPQYGGSGPGFWAGTVGECQQLSDVPPVPW